MNPSNPPSTGRWSAAVRALAVVTAVALSFGAYADVNCDIPQTVTTDKPFDATQVIASFADSECVLETLASDTLFYRYYSYPEAPTINIGRFLTTDLFTLNSDVIVKLALYPFPPNPQFQNFAYYREQVTVLAGTQLYLGLAGPQPAGAVGSCYAGGASQYFFAGANISSNTDIVFSNAAAITKDTRYTNQYGVGDPCNVVPVPATLVLLIMGVPGLIAARKSRL